MKINYEDIITLANARKEKLQAAAKALGALPEQATVLLGALDYFTNLRAAVTALDDEARGLLGAHIFQRINAITNGTGNLAAHLTRPNAGNGSDTCVLQALIDHLNTAPKDCA